MKTADFDFDLPENRIALRPADPRDSARLLVVQDGALDDRIIRDLPDFLRPGDALVFNDTRVIPARLSGVRERIGAEGETLTVPVEATLHHRDAPDTWSAFMKPGKRIKAGDRIHFQTLSATVVAKSDDGLITLRFDLSGPALDDAIREVGVMPLPPYIAAKRPEDDRDRSDYQTVFAEHDGSVAAPTAGLHFTPALLDAIRAKGVTTHAVTLHVGAGTFLPVKVDDLADHKMHSEWGEVSAETADALNAVHASGGRIVCVGTTSLRLLESATVEAGLIQPFHGDTAIFITPGYAFRAVDVLMTNFHLPKSTLFMLDLPTPLTLSLETIASATPALRDPWWVFGGTAMALAGLEGLHVPDIDILASPRDARSLLDALGGEAVPDPGEGVFRSRVFGRILTTPVPLEIMADMDIRDGGDWVPVRFHTRLPITVGDITVFIPTVQEQIDMARLFGRPKDLQRAEALERLIS